MPKRRWEVQRPYQLGSSHNLFIFNILLLFTKKWAQRTKVDFTDTRRDSPAFCRIINPPRLFTTALSGIVYPVDKRK